MRAATVLTLTLPLVATAAVLPSAKVLTPPSGEFVVPREFGAPPTRMVDLPPTRGAIVPPAKNLNMVAPLARELLPPARKFDMSSTREAIGPLAREVIVPPAHNLNMVAPLPREILPPARGFELSSTREAIASLAREAIVPPTQKLNMVAGREVLPSAHEFDLSSSREAIISPTHDLNVVAPLAREFVAPVRGSIFPREVVVPPTHEVIDPLAREFMAPAHEVVAPLARELVPPAREFGLPAGETIFPREWNVPTTHEDIAPLAREAVLPPVNKVDTLLTREFIPPAHEFDHLDGKTFGTRTNVVMPAGEMLFPRGNNDPPASQCSGSLQCCNSLDKASNPVVGLLAGLLNIVLGPIEGLIGVQCSATTVGGIGGTDCNQQAVCCTGNNFSGLLVVGCSPVNINL